MVANSVLRSAVRTLYGVLALSAFLTLALASAALADDVTNRIDTTVDATLENITLNEGASQSVNLRVVPVGGDGEAGGGCNVDAGEQFVVALTSSSTSVATLSPQALTFTGCNLDQSTTVTAGARGTATVTAAEQTNTTGTGTYNYAPASFSVTVNNVPPTISNIADRTTNEDTSTGDVAFTVGDAGTPAANLTVTGSSSNTTLVPNSNITFGGSGANRTVQVTPAADQSGTATITVSVSDGAATTSDTFVLTVNAVNDAPTVSNIGDQTTNEDTSTGNLDFTVGDVETAAGSLTVSGSSSNTTLVPNSNITFGGSGANRTVNVNPAANRSGTATITVSASDGSATTSDTFVLTVNPVNDAPAVSSVTNSGPVGEGSPASVTVTASDVEGDTLSYEFDCNNDGAFEIGPQGPNNAQCTFSDDGTYRVNVRVSDGNGGTATGFTDVTVNNVAPNAVNDSTSAQEGGSGVVIDVLANDTDVSGDPLTITGNTQPPAGEGSVSCSTSDCTFTPDADFNGATSFTYTIGDGDGGNDTATVSVTVNAVNDRPGLDLNGGAPGIDHSASFSEDGGPVSIVASGGLSVADVDDANMESASVEITNLEDGADESLAADTSGTTISASYDGGTGELSLSGGAPKADYQQVLRAVEYDNASQNPDTTDRSITFVVNDGDANSDVATSTVTVGSDNDAPVNSIPGAQTTDEDNALVFSAANGNRLSVSDADAGSGPVEVTLGATNGTLTLGGTAGLTFTTGDGTNDATMTFTASISDADTALSNLTFYPEANYNGSATLTITTDDQGNTGAGGAKSDSDTVNITVSALNDAPTADVQSVTTDEDTAKTITLTGSDVEGDAQTFEITEGPSNGNLGSLGPVSCTGTAPKDCEAEVTYTPEADHDGSDSFRFRVNDGTANSAEATVSITVNPVNDAPAAGDDNYSTGEDTELTVDASDPPSGPSPGLLGDDTDADEDALTVADADTSTPAVDPVSGPSDGTLALDADGSFTYAPDADFNGTDTFTYEATDGTAETNTATVTLTVDPVNDPPVAGNDSKQVDEDGTLTFPAADLVTNDSNGPSDESGQNLNVTAVGTAVNGTVGLASGDITFDPDANYNGPASFEYTVCDDGSPQECDAGTVNVTVTAVNDAPVNSVPGAQTTDKDTPLVFSAANGNQISVSDIDAGSGPVRVTLGATNGTLTLSGTAGLSFTTGDGTDDASMTFTGTMANINAALDGLSFEPDAIIYTGSATVSITTDDQGSTGSGGAKSDADTVDITVNFVNAAPVASPQLVTTNEDSAKTITLAGSDIDGDTLTFQITGAPAKGTLGTIGSATCTGTAPKVCQAEVTYTPDSNLNGTDSFKFRVNDGTINSDEATVSVTIVPVNDAPTISDIGDQTTNEDTATPDISFTVGDVETAAGSLTVSGSSSNTTLVPDSNITFGGSGANRTVKVTPAANRSGTATITVSVSDGSATTSDTFVLTVSAVNDAPVLDLNGNDSGVEYNTSFTEDGAPVGIVGGSGPGGLSVADVDDANMESATATLTNPLDGAAEALLVNTAGTSITTTGYDHDTGVLSLSGSASKAEYQQVLRTVEYDNASQNPDTTENRVVEFVVNDGELDSARPNSTVAVISVNDAPVAQNGSATTDEDSSKLVTLSANDVDGDSLTYKVTSLPANGRLYEGNSTEAADEIEAGDLPATLGGNQVTYAPVLNYNGSDSFGFVANDGTVDGDEATVSVTVNAVNDSPVATGDSYTVNEDGTLNSAAPGILGNDSDVDSGNLTASLVDDTDHGQLDLNPNGSFDYTPNENFFGTDSFTYKANDGGLESNAATVTITVSPVNDEPVANDDAKATPENTPLVFPASDLLANDSVGAANESGQSLFVSQVGNPQHGTVSLNNGEITFTPQTNYNGPASFEYTVCDSGTPQECSTQTATVNVTVSPVNSKPDAQNGNATMNEDGAPIQIDLSDLVSDVETSDANLSYAVVSGPTPQQGTLAPVPGSAGLYSFDSAENFNGPVEISYKVTDRGDPDNCGTPGAGCEAAKESDVKTLTITVNAVNDAPVISSVTNSGPVGEGSPASVTVAASDVEGDTLSYEFDCNNDGAFEIGPQGPNNAQCTFSEDGTYRVNVRVSDGNGGTATGFTDVTVNAVDSMAPWVQTALPVGKKVSPKAKVTARFSEEIDASTLDGDASTLDGTTFVLTRQGIQVPATVSYDASTDTAILTPSTKLKKKATYVATVTTGVEDMAGLALDQDRNPGNGDQPMVWSFKVKG